MDGGQQGNNKNWPVLSSVESGSVVLGSSYRLFQRSRSDQTWILSQHSNDVVPSYTTRYVASSQPTVIAEWISDASVSKEVPVRHSDPPAFDATEHPETQQIYQIPSELPIEVDTDTWPEVN